MSSRPAPPSNQPMGKATAAYGAKLRDQIKAGTMTNAQAQAAHNANVKQEMAKRTAADLERNKTPARDIIATKPAPPPEAVRSPEQAYQDYVGQQSTAATARNLLGALRPGVTSPTGSTSQQPIAPRSPFMVASRTPSTVAPRTPVDPGFAIDRPSTGGVKPGMSLAPTQTGSMAASGPMAAPAAAARMKKGGTAKASKPVKKMAKGGSTASSRGDGCAVRGKTKGMMR